MSVALFSLLLLTSIFSVDGVAILVIREVFLQAFSPIPANITLRLNSSCEQCLCETLSSAENVALNCFPNNTCQFFREFPLSYKLKAALGAKLYFLRNEFPNASQCCMPNITELINRLKTTTPTLINLAFQPSAFGYDENQPSEAVVIGVGPGACYWFNPQNMMFLRSGSFDYGLTIGLHNNLTFTASDGVATVRVSDSQTSSLLVNISHSSLIEVRKFVFVNDGRTMIVPTQSNFSVTFIDVQSSTNYSIQVNHDPCRLLTQLLLACF